MSFVKQFFIFFINKVLEIKVIRACHRNGLYFLKMETNVDYNAQKILEQMFGRHQKRMTIYLKCQWKVKRRRNISNNQRNQHNTFNNEMF